MKLYHVCAGFTPENQLFTPHIPDNRMRGEDASTQRICLSDSVEHCLSALYREFEDSQDEQMKITIYSINIDENDSNLIPWQRLDKNGTVPDAKWTHEYWYTAPLAMTGKHKMLTTLDCHQESVFYECERNEVRNAILDEPALLKGIHGREKEFFDAFDSMSLSEFMNNEFWRFIPEENAEAYMSFIFDTFATNFIVYDSIILENATRLHAA